MKKILFAVLNLVFALNVFSAGLTVSATNMVKTVTKVISMIPPPDGDTNWFGPWTAGTSTAGIQEALNALAYSTNRFSVGGGVIKFRTGIFQIGSEIQITNAHADTTIFEGNGMTATIILQTNQTPTGLLRCNPYGTTNGWIFQATDMAFMSVTNATTNMLSFQGVIAPSPSFAYRGNMSRAYFDRCWFAYWGEATNASPSNGLTPDVAANDGPHNLIPIWYNNNFGDDITIVRCQFTFVNSLSLANDHMSLLYNAFEGCGSVIQNAWPNTSPFSRGFVVVLNEPVGTDGNTYNNGNKAWKIEGNFFVGNAPQYLVNSQPGVPLVPIVIDRDNFETASLYVATVQDKVVLQNTTGQGTYNDNYQFFIVTNVTDWSKPFMADTGLVMVSQVFNGYSKLRFNATNSGNFFLGSFQAANRSNFSISTNGNGIVGNIGVTNGAITSPDINIRLTKNGETLSFVSDGSVATISFQGGTMNFFPDGSFNAQSPAGAFFQAGGDGILGCGNVNEPRLNIDADMGFNNNQIVDGEGNISFGSSVVFFNGTFYNVSDVAGNLVFTAQ